MILPPSRDIKSSTMSLVSLHSSSGSPLMFSNTKPTTTNYHKPRLLWRTGLLLLFSCLICQAAAESTPPSETLLLDTRIPTVVEGKWEMVSPEDEGLGRRDLELRDDSAATAPAASTTVRIEVSTAASASPLPSPLDGISANFSTTSSGAKPCPAFLNSFLTDATFRQCYPFSLLLQGSTSFFEAEKSLVSITQVLDASCSANVTFCASYLRGVAKNMTNSANCGTEFNQGNPVVVQSYLAMVSYQTLYGATCLKDPGTAAYCFANAVTNLTTPSNVYFYYLPLNISLPGSSVPSCSWCLANTMGIFQSAASNRALPIANTYVSAAQQVNTICGPTFVNATLPNAVAVSAGHPALTPWPHWLLGVLPLLVSLQWLL